MHERRNILVAQADAPWWDPETPEIVVRLHGAEHADKAAWDRLHALFGVPSRDDLRVQHTHVDIYGNPFCAHNEVESIPATAVATDADGEEDEVCACFSVWIDEQRETWRVTIPETQHVLEVGRLIQEKLPDHCFLLDLGAMSHILSATSRSHAAVVATQEARTSFLQDLLVHAPDRADLLKRCENAPKIPIGPGVLLLLQGWLETAPPQHETYAFLTWLLIGRSREVLNYVQGCDRAVSHNVRLELLKVLATPPERHGVAGRISPQTFRSQAQHRNLQEELAWLRDDSTGPA